MHRLVYLTNVVVSMSKFSLSVLTNLTIEKLLISILVILSKASKDVGH